MGVSVSVVSPRKLTTGNVRRKTEILVKPPLSIKSAPAARRRRSPFWRVQTTRVRRCNSVYSIYRVVYYGIISEAYYYGFTLDGMDVSVPFTYINTST